MLSTYAKDFNEIPDVLAKNEKLRVAISELINKHPITGKVVEEEERTAELKRILSDFVDCKYDLRTCIEQVETRLNRESSKYSTDNRVFAKGWAERLVRIQLSRFYNQAIMEALIAQGHSECFIPHSANESDTSQCSIHLAGTKQSVHALHELLVESYSNGNWKKDPKIPDHPHCTHVVTPVI